jgi:hypothetical protein
MPVDDSSAIVELFQSGANGEVCVAAPRYFYPSEIFGLANGMPLGACVSFRFLAHAPN